MDKAMRRAMNDKILPTNEMPVMDYCGVEYTAVEAGGFSWKWQLLISDTDKVKTRGEASSRAAAIDQAHEAVGEACVSMQVMTTKRVRRNWSTMRFISFTGHGAFRLPRRSRHCGDF